MQRVPFKSTKLKKKQKRKRDDIFTHTHSFSETAHVFRVVVVVTKQERTKTITKKLTNLGRLWQKRWTVARALCEAYNSNS